MVQGAFSDPSRESPYSPPADREGLRRVGRATTALSYDPTVVIDGRTLHAEAELEADVCVVGAGPSGIALTGELLNSDLRVCVLENGGTGRNVAHAVPSRRRERRPSLGSPTRDLGGERLRR